MRHEKPVNLTGPLLGQPCPVCGAHSYADGNDGSLPTCACVLAPEADWKFGADDQTEWYREGHAFSWRQLSTAEARMQHDKDAAASVMVRRIPREVGGADVPPSDS